MRIDLEEAGSLELTSFCGVDITFAGSPLDDRGKAALNELAKKSVQTIYLHYDVNNMKLHVSDGSTFYIDDTDDFFLQYANLRIAVETTTLGFVEIYLICKAFSKKADCKVSFIYVEPLEYNKPRDRMPLNKRDFELTDIVHGYRGVPGAMLRLTDRQKQRGVFFLGYEERRLDQALEDYEMLDTSRCMAVFGVPAFQAGWEMNAFANNIRVIRDKRIRGGIKFCGAEDPSSAYDVLLDIYNSLEPSEKMFIAPIGTKPHGVGAALFVTTHAGVSLIYDHPAKKPGRSKEIAKWHHYIVTF